MHDVGDPEVSASTLVGLRPFDVDAAAEELGRCRCSRSSALRDTAAAMPVVSITGRVRLKFPVISTTLAVAVSGACAAAAEHRRPWPATANTAANGDARPEEMLADHPERHPRGCAGEERGSEHAAGPADREGQAGRDHLAHHEHHQEPQHHVARPPSGSSPGSRPRTSGGGPAVGRRAPAPPTAGRAHSGRPFQSRSTRSSDLYRKVLNPKPISPATTPEHGDQQVAGGVRHDEVVRDLGEEGRRAEEGPAHQIRGDRRRGRWRGWRPGRTRAGRSRTRRRAR